MKTQKRLLAGLLAVVICLSLLLVAPIAAGATDWTNWPEGSVDTPYIQKLTIDGKDITAYKKNGSDTGYIIIDGTETGLSKQAVMAAMSSLKICVTPMNGSGIVPYNELTDAQVNCIAAMYDAAKAADFRAKTPGETGDSFIKNMVGASKGVLDGTECVGKFISIAWKDGGDYYAAPEHWDKATDPTYPWPLIQPYAVFYKGAATTTPTWTNWPEGSVDTPYIQKLTIDGKDITAYKKNGSDTGYIIIDGTETGLSKQAVMAAMSSLKICVTPMNGSGIVPYNELTDAQVNCIAAMYDAAKAADFRAKTPGETGDSFIKNMVGASKGVLDGTECVGKFISIAWKDGGDYYAAPEHWDKATDPTYPWPLIQPYAVFYKDAATPTLEITSITTRNLKKLMEHYATPDAGVEAYVNTKNAEEGTKLKIVQVKNAAGDTLETLTTGLDMTIGTINAKGVATITIKTTAQTPGGTYYFKVSDETRSVSKVQSFEVKKTYGVTLSVSPAAAAKVWKLSASYDKITGTNETVYLPAGVKGNYSSSTSLAPVDSSGKDYCLSDHPASGEAYGDGKMYLLSHYEIKKDGVADDNTVVNIMGRKLNGITLERNTSGKETMLVPAYDISVTAVFVEAYQLSLGDLPASSLFSWYRKGDTVDLTNSIAAAEKAAQAKKDPQLIQSVLVYKTGDESVKVLEKTASQGYANVSFKMPAYPVSVKVTYAADPTPRLTAVSKQHGILIAGRKGETTLEITTKNVPDGTKLTIAACGITGTANTVNGLNLSISEVKDNKATVTVTTTEAITAGAYYFKLSMPDKTVLKYSQNYHGTVTVSAAETKNLSLGAQTGELTAGAAGSATYAGTAFNLADTDTLTVAETDAKGTLKEIGKTTGLTLSVSAIKSEKFTVTAAITADVKEGTYYFAVSGADLKSAVASVVVQKKPEAKTYQIKTETYKNGYVSLNKQEAKEKETVELTINPNTGYVLDSISVVKTDGTAVTLVGTGNTRTFEMPASDVTVKATFKETDEETHRITVVATPGGTVTVSPTEASKGQTVTVTVTPDSGKQMVAGSLKYSEAKAGGNVVTISGNTFVMPDVDVSVSCQFETAKEGSADIVITSFTINGVSAAINNESRIITIVMPYGTDLSKVAPVIVGKNIQSMTPASAQLVDLRNSKVYRFYAADGTYVSYNVSAYTEDPSPSQSLWEKLQDQINSNPNWWELAESQKKSGYYR